MWSQVGLRRHQRADTLKPYSEKSSQSNHTRTTALSNSMKPCSPRDSQESSPTPQFKSINSLVLSFLYCPTLASIHDYWKNHWWTFVDKVVSLLFNKLSRLVITFLRRSKHLLISWLQSPSAVILESPQNKVSHCFYRFPIYLPRSNGSGCHDLRFLNVEL